MATLYLMLGYPGAGKTTAARVVHDVTGAVHLWADQVRRQRFGTPTYSDTENDRLYTDMNQTASRLLLAGKSVVFDTNFNYLKDRDHLRQLARRAGADTIVLWVTVNKQLAKQRATQDAHTQNSRVLGDMPHEDFDRLADNLEPPQPGEQYIALDGTKITPDYIKQHLHTQ